MKKIRRYLTNKEYWNKRWSEFKEDSKFFKNGNIYPIKYSDITLLTYQAFFNKSKSKPKILECGCGLGRVLKHYHYQNYHIKGFDNNELAVKKVRKFDRKLNCVKSDIIKLPYKANFFDIAFAFGVFHNLEDEFVEAINEVMRCVKHNGVVCFSFASENIATRIRESGHKGKQFYKWHFTEKDIQKLMLFCGIKPIMIETVQNIPMLYKYKWFRNSKNERQNRTKGYKLNRQGEIINNFLLKLFPKQFGDTIIVIGQKIRS